MKATIHPISPRLASAAASQRTEQKARYQRVLANIAERRDLGQKTVSVALTDLEALLCLAATTDMALAP